MTKTLMAAILLSTAAMSAPAFADALGEATDTYCEKMKGCAMAQLEDADGMTDAVKQQIAQSLDGICVPMRESMTAAISHHPLYDPAVACLQSLNSLSCGEIEELAGDGTAECQAFQKAAEKY